MLFSLLTPDGKRLWISLSFTPSVSNFARIPMLSS
jgi:hypothetical protein